MRSLYLAVFLDSLGYGISYPALAFYVSSISQEKPSLLLGSGWAAYYVAHLIGSFMFGSISDRIGRKPVMLAAMLWQGLSFVALTFLAASKTTHASEFFLLRQFLTGLFGGTLLPSQSVILDGPREKRAHGLSVLAGMHGGGIALGELTTAILRDATVTLPLIFMLASVFCLIATVIVLLFLPETHQNRAMEPRYKSVSDVPDGLWKVWLTRFGLTAACYGLATVYPKLVKEYFTKESYLAHFLFFGSTVETATFFLLFPLIENLCDAKQRLTMAASLAAVSLAILPYFMDFFNIWVAATSLVTVHLIWKILFNSSVAIAEATIPDALGIYATDLGFSQGVLGVFKSLAVIIGAPLTGWANDQNPAMAFLVISCFAGIAVMASASIDSRKIHD